MAVEVRREREPVIPLLALLGVAAALLLFFWVVRHPPPDYGCGDEAPPDQDARLAAYRAGLRGIHVGAAMLLVAALVSTSRERAPAGRPGRPTLVMAAIALVWAFACLVDDDAVWPLVVAGLVALLASPVVMLVALVVVVLAWTRKGPPPRWRWPVAAGLTWIAVVLLIPGHAGAVLLQGSGPLLC